MSGIETLVSGRNDILADGRILLHGDSQTIYNDPLARKYYLGDNFSM